MNFQASISLEARKAILHDARAAALWVEIPSQPTQQRWSRETDDDTFIRTALAAQAPWLVSGDEDLLTVPAVEGLHVLTPGQSLLEWCAT